MKYPKIKKRKFGEEVAWIVIINATDCLWKDGQVKEHTGYSDDLGPIIRAPGFYETKYDAQEALKIFLIETSEMDVVSSETWFFVHANLWEAFLYWRSLGKDISGYIKYLIRRHSDLPC